MSKIIEWTCPKCGAKNYHDDVSKRMKVSQCKVCSHLEPYKE